MPAMRRTLCLASSRALCALTHPRPVPEPISRRILPPLTSCARSRSLRHAASPQDDAEPTSGRRRLLPVPKGYTTQQHIDRSGRDRPPWDHEITDPLIMVIDSGAMEGPLETAYVLTKLEPGESLRMIQPYFPGDAPRPPPPERYRRTTEATEGISSQAEGISLQAEGIQQQQQPLLLRQQEVDPELEAEEEEEEQEELRERTYAICKIVNKRDEYERQKLLKERKRTAALLKPKTKELEITWAISSNDLAVKMGRMRAFLGKGMKVELTIGRKKGGKQVTADEAAGILRRVREEMEGSGGREGRAASGTMGGTMRIYLEGVSRRP